MRRDDPALPTPPVDHIIRPVSAERLCALFGADLWAEMEPQIISACELPGNRIYVQRADRVTIYPIDLAPVRQRVAKLVIDYVREEEARKARAAG